MKSASKKRINEVQQLQALIFWITLGISSAFSVYYLLKQSL